MVMNPVNFLRIRNKELGQKMAVNGIKRFLETNDSSLVLKNVAVFGGGLMGSGIAQVAAQAGYNVILVEVNKEALKSANNRITKSLDRVAKKLYKEDGNEAKKFIEATLSNIKDCTDPNNAVQDADLVIEAVVENIQVKRDLFKTLDAAAPKKTIFTSNTSSLGIGEIASVTNRKDRFGGLHFFGPVPVMKLLEVVKAENTSESTIDILMKWGKSIGKTCIRCNDTPGFIVNRLLIPYSMEAFKMVERGDATFEDVDTAMRLGAGYPMGPFELCDYEGLDTAMSILEIWRQKFPDDPMFQKSKILENLIKEGKLGRKTGEGFYKYY